MMKLNRINRIRQQFYLTELSDGRTEIRCVSRMTLEKEKEKGMIVNHHISKLSQSWYDWMMKADFIQVAFPYLTPDEREFIQSGTTPEEWNLLFPSDEIVN
jgi:hypothetical protein